MSYLIEAEENKKREIISNVSIDIIYLLNNFDNFGVFDTCLRDYINRNGKVPMELESKFLSLKLGLINLFGPEHEISLRGVAFAKNVILFSFASKNNTNDVVIYREVLNDSAKASLIAHIGF